jgi:glycosyltransferase involved in cell wall biosynthesis
MDTSDMRPEQSSTGEPLRLLFFSHYFPPEGNAPASRTYEMCRRWVREGHQVTVITSAPNHPHGVLYPGYKNRLISRQVVDGIDVVRVWTFLAANKGKKRRALNFLSYMLTAIFVGLFVKRPNLVIATSPQFFCGWAGVVVSFLRKLPFVLEIRDIWPESIVAVGAMKKRLPLRILEWLERRMYASAKRIVTVGEGYRDRLVERGVPPEKLSVVTNGVDEEIFIPRAGDPALRDRYALNGSFVCAYIGTVGMACGLDVVLRAGDALRRKGRSDIKFLIVGDGAEKAELERKARELRLKNVIFAGMHDKQSMPAFLATADACLVHLRKQRLFESVLPSKIFEAAGMGKPIVLGVEGYAAGLIRKLGAGVCIVPEDADGLVQAVERLADDRRFASELGASGQRGVLREFTREKLSRQYLRILRQTLDGTRTVPQITPLPEFRRPIPVRRPISVSVRRPVLADELELSPVAG